MADRAPGQAEAARRKANAVRMGGVSERRRIGELPTGQGLLAAADLLELEPLPQHVQWMKPEQVVLAVYRVGRWRLRRYIGQVDEPRSYWTRRLGSLPLGARQRLAAGLRTVAATEKPQGAPSVADEACDPAPRGPGLGAHG